MQSVSIGQALNSDSFNANLLWYIKVHGYQNIPWYIYSHHDHDAKSIRSEVTDSTTTMNTCKTTRALLLLGVLLMIENAAYGSSEQQASRQKRGVEEQGKINTNSDDRAELLDRHNTARKAVSPTSANMKEMVRLSFFIC